MAMVRVNTTAIERKHMRKSEYLSKYEKKHYTKLLKKKLEEVGVQDQILMQSTGKFRLVPKNSTFRHNPKTPLTPEYVEKNFDRVPISMACNTQRRLIKRLLTLTRKAVEDFLKADLSAAVPKAEKGPNES